MTTRDSIVGGRERFVPYATSSLTLRRFAARLRYARLIICHSVFIHAMQCLLLQRFKLGLQRLIFSARLFGHGFHHLKFLTRDEAAVADEALDLIADHGFKFAAHIHEAARRTRCHFGNIFEQFGIFLHFSHPSPVSSRQYAHILGFGCHTTMVQLWLERNEIERW